jgi:NitT/TauT family transport system ATP-binding protein
MEANMTALRFDRVSKEYRRGNESIQAFANIDLNIQDREFVALLGPSGCGKTTMLRLFAGLEYPTSGEVLVGDRQVLGPGPDRAVVFQQFALFPWMTVRQNIEFGLKCMGADKATRCDRSVHYIDLMGLSGHEDAFPSQLSGGMQQRVAIARSYAINSEVLLMDEPFAALDTQTRQIMQEALADLIVREPRTVLFVTHSVEEALYLADRVIVLGARPARVRTSLDISATRRSECWNQQLSTSLLSNAKFNEIRASIWEILREEISKERGITNNKKMPN